MIRLKLKFKNFHFLSRFLPFLVSIIFQWKSKWTLSDKWGKMKLQIWKLSVQKIFMQSVRRDGKAIAILSEIKTNASFQRFFFHWILSILFWLFKFPRYFFYFTFFIHFNAFQLLSSDFLTLRFIYWGTC